MTLWPFSKSERKKQRTWSAVLSLGGILLIIVGLLNNYPIAFLGINMIMLLGIFFFIIGIIYLVDIID